MAVSKKKVNKDLARVLTPTFRVSYPHVFKPQRVKPTDKPKHSITMLFAKNSDLTAIKEAIKQAKIAKFGPDRADWPEELESPVNDGDAQKNADKEGYKGHWAIKATANEESKPGVVDADMNEIISPSEFYPGCYARAYIFAYVWEYMGKQGVGFILDHVQKVKDGKSFGGKKPVDQVFTPVSSGDDDIDEDTEDFM